MKENLGQGGGAAMAGNASGRILRDVRRIFEVGVVGSMSDAQLFGKVRLPERRIRGGSPLRADDPAWADGPSCVPVGPSRHA